MTYFFKVILIFFIICITFCQKLTIIDDDNQAPNPSFKYRFKYTKDNLHLDLECLPPTERDFSTQNWSPLYASKTKDVIFYSGKGEKTSDRGMLPKGLIWVYGSIANVSVFESISKQGYLKQFPICTCTKWCHETSNRYGWLSIHDGCQVKTEAGQKTPVSHTDYFRMLINPKSSNVGLHWREDNENDWLGIGTKIVGGLKDGKTQYIAANIKTNKDGNVIIQKYGYAIIVPYGAVGRVKYYLDGDQKGVYNDRFSPPVDGSRNQLLVTGFRADFEWILINNITVGNINEQTMVKGGVEAQPSSKDTFVCRAVDAKEGVQVAGEYSPTDRSCTVTYNGSFQKLQFSPKNPTIPQYEILTNPERSVLLQTYKSKGFAPDNAVLTGGSQKKYYVGQIVYENLLHIGTIEESSHTIHFIHKRKGKMVRYNFDKPNFRYLTMEIRGRK